jgi:hypothetical protein
MLRFYCKTRIQPFLLPLLAPLLAVGCDNFGSKSSTVHDDNIAAPTIVIDDATNTTRPLLPTAATTAVQLDDKGIEVRAGDIVIKLPN